MDGRDLVVLASNDYLDLARDPRVTEAAATAARTWGAGAGGARLTTGTQPPHVALEAALARFKGTEAALVYGTGYMAKPVSARQPSSKASRRRSRWATCPTACATAA